jgi:transposase-like protein
MNAKHSFLTPCSMSILNTVSSEAKIRSLVRKTVFAGRVRCPSCSSSKVRRIECRFWCRKCRRKFSLTSASWLIGMKLSYRQFWILLVCFQRKYTLPAASELAGVSIPTARRWYRKFQYNIPRTEAKPLSGEVEIDEAFVGRRRYGNQRIVIGALERRTGRIALQIIPNRAQETTDIFILQNINQKETTVYTDCFSSYRGIDLFFGYRHETCNHSQYIFGPTNRIEAVWSAFKRWIRRSWQQVKACYLADFVREFEARTNEPELFESPLNYLKKSLICSISFT